MKNSPAEMAALVCVWGEMDSVLGLLENKRPPTSGLKEKKASTCFNGPQEEPGIKIFLCVICWLPQ